ncbi:hypothetical protein, unknown function [Leishmania tarentolae]|uniref:Transmembrane protein n=1 Tax=Leishmania tarentolae TaxID=5689 RepID=A0A640KN10_LEITA|nr:hypothetical protein, unknown function [Leishmania tarentolae]
MWHTTTEMMHLGDGGVKPLSFTNQAARGIDPMEQGSRLTPGLPFEEGDGTHPPVLRGTMCAICVLACISVLLSAALSIFWVIIAFFFGVVIVPVEDTEFRDLAAAVLVVSICGAVAYLLMTLLVGVHLGYSLACGCKTPKMGHMSCCQVVTCVLLFLFSCALSCLTGLLLVDSQLDHSRDMLTALCALTVLCTLSFGAYFLLLLLCSMTRV